MPTVSTLKVENILEKIVQSETSLSDVIDMNMHVFENEICSESDITTFHDILSVDDADTRQTRCVLPVLGHFPPDTSPNDTSPPMLFRFVARFARVRIGNSSRNRFASTAYFAESKTSLFPCILFMGRMFRGGNNRSGTFRGKFCGGNIPVTISSTLPQSSIADQVPCSQQLIGNRSAIYR